MPNQRTDLLSNTTHDIVEELALAERQAQRRAKWCKRCGRKHPKGPCKLVEVHVPASSGRIVKRMVHP